MVVPTMAFGWLVIASMFSFSLCYGVYLTSYFRRSNHIYGFPQLELYLVHGRRCLSDTHRPYYLGSHRRFVISYSLAQYMLLI